MTPPTDATAKSQLDRFKEAAREAGLNDADEEAHRPKKDMGPDDDEIG